MDTRESSRLTELKAGMQEAGSFLADMVVPNIPAFIAWGLLTALFIPSGWIPNADLARPIEPMIFYLLPLLIGFTGGRLIYGIRGGVVGAVATMGVISGSSIPMFIGAMIVGPLGGWLVKQCDEWMEKKIPTGFEMLISNFSAGILGMGLTLLAYILIGPVVEVLTQSLGAGAAWFTEAGLLPLMALIIEPGKILFLNNAINHGVLAPLGIAQVQETGQSIFFLLETNPGPGLGLLLAYTLFGSGMAQRSSPGAAVIHLFGGIHEIYFPYVLMNPVSLAALIAGGMAANMTFVAFGAGLLATPSPGSIFAQVALSPPGGLVPVLLGIAAGTAVSCLVAIPLVRWAGESQSDPDALTRAERRVEVNRPSRPVHQPARPAGPATIFFACEAGMGSSAIGAAILKNKLEATGSRIQVAHAAISEIPAEAETIVAHRSLIPRVRQIAPDAVLYAIDDFINSPVYDELVREISSGSGKG